MHRSNLEKARAVKDTMRAEGRDRSHGGEAQQKRAATHAEQMRRNREREADPKHAMTEADYRERVLSLLRDLPVRVLMEVKGVRARYADRCKGAAPAALGDHARADPSQIAASNQQNPYACGSSADNIDRIEHSIEANTPAQDALNTSPRSHNDLKRWVLAT